jgi:glucose-1-phosphate thymidylyltransferase
LKAVVLAGGPSKQLKYVMGRDGSRSLLRFPGKRLLEKIVAEAKRYYSDIVVVSDDLQVGAVCREIGCRFVEQTAPGIESAICSGLRSIAADGFVTIIYGDVYAADGFIESHANRLVSDYEPTISVTRPLVLRGTYLRLIVDPVSLRVEKTGEGSYVYAGIFSAPVRLLRERICNSGYSVHRVINELADNGNLVASVWLDTWVDIDTVWDYLVAVRLELDKLTKTVISPRARLGRNIVIEGPVVIEDDAAIDHCAVIKGPVYIGRGAFIGAHAFIRRGSAIFDSARIGAFTEIKRSIVYDNARVYSYSYIADSIIGKDAEVESYTVTLNVPYEGVSNEVIIMSTHPLERLKVGAVIAAGSSTRPRETIKPATIYTG